jgi:GT2 family glycosyltransferase
MRSDAAGIASPRQVSIVIVSFNTLALLRDCLASLSRSNAGDVIVVDNLSHDGSPDMVENEFPTVRLIRNAENGGFAKGSNLGIKKARGDYILLLNSDTIVRPGALDVMTGFLDTNPSSGAVGCRLLNEDGSIQASISNRVGPFTLLLRLLGVSGLIASDRVRRLLSRYLGFMLGKTIRSYLAPYMAVDAPIEVENISAACLMIRRDVIDQIGLLDERFFMYLEDVDYCLRMRQAGWKLHYLPRGEVIHLSGGSSGGRMRNYSVYSYRSLFQYYRKHFSPAIVFAVRLMVATALTIRWSSNWIRSKLSANPVYRQNEQDLRQIIGISLSPLEG